MAKQVISVGSAANDGTGDALRTAFQKSNANFTELYNLVDENRYTLPAATNSVLGGVRIGNNISVFNGVISVASQVQPDWNATSGLGQILNKPADNILKNDAYFISLTQDGNLNLPEYKQITSSNPNANNGLGAVGRVGWFNHPDENYLDGSNTRVWGLFVESDVVIRTGNATNSSPYWHFSKTGNLVLPQNGMILNSDGTNYLNFSNLINKPNSLRFVDGTPPAQPIGNSNDAVGDVKHDTNYIYICVQNYDGIAQIWKRIAIDNTWGA